MPRLQLLRLRLGIPSPVVGQTKKDNHMTTTTALVPTTHASRYLQQICKHWQHNLEVEFTPVRGTIRFPKDARGATWTADATTLLEADPAALKVTIDASSPEHLDAMKGVVARHLDRFAFREAPLPFDWHDS